MTKISSTPVNVYSNDGSTLLKSYNTTSEEQVVVTMGIQSNYLYGGTKKFIGISSTANTTTPGYPIGSTARVVESTTNNYYIVEAELTETYRKLTYSDAKIQVDSAVRDGNGARIDTTYVPTSRTINGKALSSDVTLSASDVSAVPTTRTVNSKALSSDITLNASDVGALPSNTAYVSTVNGQSGAVTVQASLTFTDVSLIEED